MPLDPPMPTSSSLLYPLTPVNGATLPPRLAASSLPSRMMMKGTTSYPSSSLSTHPNDQPASAV
ncbi:hypothetical protein PIB30_115798 [Stylosanthes scabra]|uniref:Uncharacterized protein n=2 Tax=Stylosanthes scabra TaxID=79078 RepID=A0ABU6T3W5_9FABA|nr:hypothetical protein [Stylosanthes scabra]